MTNPDGADLERHRDEAEAIAREIELSNGERSDPTEAAYEAAARALHERYPRGWTSCADNLYAHMGRARELTRAAVDAVWPLGVAEGRRQTAEAIAQEIELTNGARCPECRGKPASLKWRRGSLVRLGRCGAGHTWEHRWVNSRSAEQVARDYAVAAIAKGTDHD